MKSTLKILSVGNSFSVDTMEHVADIALSLGFESVKLGNLYIGGCSIRRHYENAENNLALYEYLVNTGDGWCSTLDHRMSDVIKSEQWDVISIQHGSADGSLYTDAAYYEKLPALVQYIKALAGEHTKIAFNMTWIGEPYHSHAELRSYNGDQLLMYRKLAQLTDTVVRPTSRLDIVSPTGTAIQNARTALPFELTRDGYHLSLDVGRYIAGLTFFKALTGLPIDAISWAPDGMDAAVKRVVIASVNAAIKNPFAVTAQT